MNSSLFLTAYLIVLGLVGMGLAIPLLRGKVRRNRLYGFRTQLTLSSDEIWYAANRMAGKWMLGWGVMNLVLGAVHLILSPYLLPIFAPYSQTVESAFRMAPVTTIVLVAAGLMIWVQRKFGPARKS